MANFLTPDQNTKQNLFRNEPKTILTKISNNFNNSNINNLNNINNMNCLEFSNRGESKKQFLTILSPKFLIQVKDQIFEKLFRLMNLRESNFLNSHNLNLQSIFDKNSIQR